MKVTGMPPTTSWPSDQALVDGEVNHASRPRRQASKRSPEPLNNLIPDTSLAGCVLVFWNGRQPALIPVPDPAYAALEPYRP